MASVADQLKGQMPMAFAVVKDPAAVDRPRKGGRAREGRHEDRRQGSLGAIARPARVHFISGLPKTRSGKMLRRSIQALAEGRDPGDLTTIARPEAPSSRSGRPWSPSKPAAHPGFKRTPVKGRPLTRSAATCLCDTYAAVPLPRPLQKRLSPHRAPPC